MKTLLTIVVGILVLLLVYGAAVEPRAILDVEEQIASVPDLPPEWEGQRVAVLADFQLGMWWSNRGMAERAIREAIDRDPAVVLLAGDFIYHPDQSPIDLVGGVRELLAPLADSGIPTYAVLGNHDWGMDVEEGTINREAARLTEETLETLGIPVLRNEALPLSRDADVAPAAPAPLYVVGLGSDWAENVAPEAALAEVPNGSARIVFMHNPDSFTKIPAGAAPFAVAGHTHGGQIRVPGTPRWSWLALVRNQRVTADGWIPDYGAPGNLLYVNRGIGFSDIPVRLFCPPELTIFTLRSDRSAPAGS